MSRRPRKRYSFRDEKSTDFAAIKPERYIYRVEQTDELVEVEMCFGELLEREEPGGFLRLPDGRLARRSLPAEFARDNVKTRHKTRIFTRAKWPLVSVNAGVNPNQKAELEQFWKDRGVTGCRVLPNGDIEYQDRRARKRDMEERGLFDRDGGYSDAQPKNV